jgi:hypothetical protein
MVTKPWYLKKPVFVRQINPVHKENHPVKKPVIAENGPSTSTDDAAAPAISCLRSSGSPFFASVLPPPIDSRLPQPCRSPAQTPPAGAFSRGGELPPQTILPK